MPPPPSYLDITATPYSQLVAQADFNAGTYGGVANECWFRFVTAVDIAFGGFCDKGGTFVPITTVYANDGTTVLHTINPSVGSPRSWWFTFTADTYYIKITRNGGGASDFNFTANFDTRPILATVDPGSLIINDDAGGFPAVVMNRTTGEISGILTQIPAGEMGDIFPDGVQIWQNVQAPFGLKLFDANINLLATLDDHAVTFALLSHSDNDFYFFYNGDVDKITKVGVQTVLITGTGITDVQAICINADATVMYYITGDNFSNPANDGIIKAWDLVNNVALPDFYTIAGFSNANGDRLAITANNGNPGDLLRLSDGSLVTWAYDGLNDIYSIYHINSSGTLLNKIDYTGFGGTYGLIDHICHNVDDPLSVCVWFYKDSNAAEANFSILNLSTGVLTNISNTDMFGVGINLHFNSNIIFAPSNSCTVLLYQLLSNPARLIVIKNAIPTDTGQTFDFTTTGGLTPSTFSLGDGESQIFEDLVAGTYGVSETAVPNWATAYGVSNGDPHDAIVLADGDEVTVTVTNTRQDTSRSGIYKVVPGKRNDTLWVDVALNVTENVKIPDPFFKTALIGE